MDGALEEAVYPSPSKRREGVSEAIHDLRTPNPAFSGTETVPLAERDPLLFWEAVSLPLARVVLHLSARRAF